VRVLGADDGANRRFDNDLSSREVAGARRTVAFAREAPAKIGSSPFRRRFGPRKQPATALSTR